MNKGYLLKYFLRDPHSKKLINPFVDGGFLANGDSYEDTEFHEGNHDDEFILGLDNKIHHNTGKHIGYSTLGHDDPIYTLLDVMDKVDKSRIGGKNKKFLPSNIDEIDDFFHYVQVAPGFSFTDTPYSRLLNAMSRYNDATQLMAGNADVAPQLTLISTPLDKIITAKDMVEGNATAQRDVSNELVTKAMTIEDYVNQERMLEEYQDAMDEWLMDKVDSSPESPRWQAKVSELLSDTGLKSDFKNFREEQARNILEKNLGNVYIPSDEDVKFIIDDLGKWVNNKQRQNRITDSCTEKL